ncbi:hypothetical protein GPJ56_003285 [Histomonas meleagridis]|uniref:uncharacterized protein n=1 Tax=Histomonas meleagridis TaxID=135588 RepID=UPI00355AC339|nr:hypothetical protein GPJ56_003285 [Histomonas meleagridis]KAH0805946.1 hypothetical protein GO595_001277 [Histomonas meleagridis]
MVVSTLKLSQTPLRIGCYRKRLIFIEGDILYTEGDTVISMQNGVIFKANGEIFDITKKNDKIYCITNSGEVSLISETPQYNTINPKYGIFSAVEPTENFLAAAHDLSHSVRIIDLNTFQTINTIQLPGIITGISSSTSDILLTSDDHSLTVIDSREMAISSRSGSLVSAPKSILSLNGKAIVSCEDRKIRIFDQRKLKTPLITTKPSTKNGTISLYSTDTNEIVCVGCDEGMTLVDTQNDIGQFKRCKYLAESPWITAPVMDEEGKFSLLTRGGVLHQFTDPILFLKSQQK